MGSNRSCISENCPAELLASFRSADFRQETEHTAHDRRKSLRILTRQESLMLSPKQERRQEHFLACKDH
jgi:hypothetical protein